MIKYACDRSLTGAGNLRRRIKEYICVRYSVYVSLLRNNLTYTT